MREIAYGYPNLMCFGNDVVNCPIVDRCPRYKECNKQYDEGWLRMFDGGKTCDRQEQKSPI